LSEEKSKTSEALYCWHAHVFLFNRRKCVLVMNNETRYNFILYGLKKDDFKRFDELLVKNITENLRADGIDQEIIEHYLEGHGQIQYAPTSDRSIIGQINEMIMVTQYKLEAYKDDNIEPDLYKINRMLNRFIMLKLPLLYSGETMRVALQKL
jgi:hypothetical protein